MFDLDSTLDKLEWEMSSHKAIELNVREDITTMHPAMQNDPSAVGYSSVTYIETPSGNRFLDRAFHAANGRHSRSQLFSNGKQDAAVFFKKGSLVEQEKALVSAGFGQERLNGFNERPTPLHFFFAGKIPLYEILRKGTLTGTGEVASRKTDIIRAENVRWTEYSMDLEVHLDQDTGIPLRLAYGKDLKSPHFVWVAQSLDRYGDYHLPGKSVRTSYPIGGGTEVLMETRSTVESAVFDRDYPDSQFWPTPQKGIVFRGNDRTKRLETTSEREPKPDFALPESSVRTGTISALPEQGLSSWVPHISLGLGVALIVVGIVSHFVRRGR